MCYSNHRYCKEYGRLNIASITNVLLSDVRFYGYYLVDLDLPMTNFFLYHIYDQLIFRHFRQNKIIS